MSGPTPAGGAGLTGRRHLVRRRRQQQRRRLVAVAVVLGLIATAALTAWLVRRAPEPVAEIEPQTRTQRTLLLQVRGADGGALASALLASDDEVTTGSSGAVVLVPSQLIVEVPGAGTVPFGQAIATGDPNGSRNALADLLGVTIDGSWVLDPAAFAALVDGLGGVTADVDVPVVADAAVVVPQGTQRLDGARALAVLGYLAPGEPEQSRLARAQEVIDGLLTALPAEPVAVGQRIASLGAGSVTSGPATEVAELLVALKQDGEDDRLQYEALPVVPIDPGGGVTAFRLDAEAARALVDRALAQSVPEGARQGGNRVLVLNGVGRPGLGEEVRSRLVEADFVFVGSRNAERFGQATTQVLVPEATPEAQALGERVARALGVEPDVRQADLGSIADVVVVVGADFQS